MKQFTIFVLLFLLLLLSYCSKNPFCKGKQKKDMACPLIYKPVCGCDGITYGNDCEAESMGVKRYTEGACK